MVVTSQMRGEGLKVRALWYDAPGSAIVRDEILDASCPPGMALVATKWSAISRGTERLVMSGKVPAAEYGLMRAPFQSGDFPFPVKYGYCAAGIVEDGPAELAGKHVFALHPHQDRFYLAADQLCVLPDGLPLRRAALAANMETALNAVWDSGAGPGDNIIVIGAGIVGLLIAYLCARIPGTQVTAIDPLPERAAVASAFGARFQLPEAPLPDGGADIVFHTSASQQGLALALHAAGTEARVVEVSWYGDKDITINLGGSFHSRRLQLVSSQVGHVSPSRQQRWTYRRRLAKALELLCDSALDALVTEEFAFEDLPQKLPAYLNGKSAGLAALVRY